MKGELMSANDVLEIVLKRLEVIESKIDEVRSELADKPCKLHAFKIDEISKKCDKHHKNDGGLTNNLVKVFMAISALVSSYLVSGGK